MKFVRDELSQFVSGEREALMLDRDTFAGDIDQIKHSQVKPMTPVQQLQSLYTILLCMYGCCVCPQAVTVASLIAIA